jgi:hypothetical protein
MCVFNVCIVCVWCSLVRDETEDYPALVPLSTRGSMERASPTPFPSTKYYLISDRASWQALG